MESNAPEHLILYTISEHNILPVTSKCNAHCIFCSHHHNPPGIETYYLAEQTLSTLKNWVNFLDSKKKIVIGESATRICEGEPFSYPAIMELLSYIRLKYPKTPIQITTNGTFLTKERLKQLAALGSIELYISLNSISLEGRRKLMPGAGVLDESLLADLACFGLPYHGSLVAMPWLVGWDDLSQTIQCLDKYEAKTIRVFMPGYSRLTPRLLRFPQNFSNELVNFINSMRTLVETPLTLEPPCLRDLTAQVAGVIRNSPAFLAGIKAGDVILEVNGEKVFSRAEAFKKVLAEKNPQLFIKRNDQSLKFTIPKAPRETSGLVMDYDLSWEEIQRIGKVINSAQAKSALLFVSQAGYKVLDVGLKNLVFASSLKLIPVKNKYFGGSIITAGLLTVEDFKMAWEKMDEKSKVKCDLIILPQKAFDHKGRDLTGVSYWELEDFTGVAVTLA